MKIIGVRAWIFSSLYKLNESGEFTQILGEVIPEGYVPAEGSTITNAWMDYDYELRLDITEPSGRELRVMLNLRDIE